MKENIICLLFGHAGEATESGYHVCDRCGMHEYYCSEHCDPGLSFGDYHKHSYLTYPFHWAIYFLKKLPRKIFPLKCIDCNRRYICDKTKEHLPF